MRLKSFLLYLSIKRWVTFKKNMIIYYIIKTFFTTLFLRKFCLNGWYLDKDIYNIENYIIYSIASQIPLYLTLMMRLF